MPGSWLELDRDAVRGNVDRLRAIVAPARLMPVVKANHYGAGAVPIARELATAGVDAFAVASVREAVELREAGIAGRLVVLTYFDRAEVDTILARQVEPVVFTEETAAWLSTGAALTGRRARVWLKIDTGLGRIGVPSGAAADFGRRVAKLPGVEIAGLLSTLAENPARTETQVARLRGVAEELRDVGRWPLSIASTQGILTQPASYLDYVRPGLALLGVLSGLDRLDPVLVARAALRPVVTWKARVAYVKRVPAGEQVGYGVRPALAQETPIATLAVGWADGYAQTLQGAAHVLVKGRRCPVLAISANSTLVDVTPARDVAIGDEAVLLGGQGDERIATDEIARVIGSHYRVLAGIPVSAPRGWG